MLPYTYALSNIQNPISNRSLVNLRNQYSILNRLKYRDILANFSVQIETKLPKISTRLKKYENKQNQLKEIQLKEKLNQQHRDKLNRDLNDIKKLVLNHQKSCRQMHCFCDKRLPQIIPLQFIPINQCMTPHQCQQCSSKNKQKHKNQPSSKKQQSQNSINQKSNEKTGNKNNTKNRRKSYKLRKYVYAVYFCIFLKYYSIKFTKNRYKFFKQRYLQNYGQRVKQESFKITKSFQAIDIMKIIAKSPDYIQNITNLSINDSYQQIEKRKSLLIPQKIENQFKKALNFINVYLKQLERIALKQKFVENFGEIIGIGTLNQSFFMDDLMIPQQIRFLTFSQKKGFAQIRPQTQKILVTIYIFIKHILFKILFKVEQKKYLDKVDKKQYGQLQIQEKQQIYKFLELSSALLYSIINSMYLEYTDEFKAQTNYDKLKKRFKVEPAKILSTPECPKQLKQKINYEQLVVGVRRVQEVNKCMESNEFQDYLGHLVGMIQTFIQKLYHKVKDVNDFVYNHLKDVTIKQPYIIFEGLKNQQGQKLRTMKTLKQTKSVKQFPRQGTKNQKKQAGNNKLENISNLGSRYSNTSLGNIAKLRSKRI